MQNKNIFRKDHFKLLSTSTLQTNLREDCMHLYECIAVLSGAVQLLFL